MEGKAEFKNRNVLPRTLEEFMAQKKKQPTTTSISNGKKSARIDDKQSLDHSKPDKDKDNDKDPLLDDDDTWDPNRPLKEIGQTLIYSQYELIRQEMRDQHFDELRTKVMECLKKIPNQNSQATNVAQLMRELQIQLIGSGDLETLEREFQKSKVNRGYSLVDPILQRNKLIGIFSRDKREELYRSSQLLVLSKDTEVYKEGSQSGSMYIIIKGYVKILETKETSYGQKIVLEFTTLHQGSHFGSNALGDEELKHNAHTVMTTSKTYLLKISSFLYKQLMVNSEENGFEKKIQVIGLISFMRSQTKMSLTPLVSSMKILTYKFGQMVVRRGSTLDKIWIVGQGSLQVFLQQRAKKKVVSTQERSKERSFVFGNCKIKPLNKKRFADTLYFPEEPTEKSLLYGNKVLLNNDQIEYTDQIVFGQLQRGQCFGGRALYPEFYKSEKQKRFPEYGFDPKARLDVCCSCTKAVVYELDQKRFAGLPDSLQKILIEGLCSSKDFDYEDIESKVKQKGSWKQCASKIIQIVQKDNRGQRAKSLMSR